MRKLLVALGVGWLSANCGLAAAGIFSAAEDKPTLFTRAELAAAQDEVVELVGLDLAALGAADGSPIRAARILERQMTKGCSTNAVGFLLARGAFLLYAEADDRANARRVLAWLRQDGCSESVLLKLLGESGLEVRCAQTDCPLRVRTFLAEAQDGQSMRLADDEVGELMELRALEFGKGVFSSSARRTKVVFESSPGERKAIDVWKSTIRLAGNSQAERRLELFYTLGTKRLYKVEFKAFYGGWVDRAAAVNEFSELGRQIYAAWGVSSYAWKPVSSGVDNQIECEHERAIDAYRSAAGLVSLNRFGVQFLSDYGVFDFRLDGILKEDIHNGKFLRVVVVSEPLLELARQEGGCRLYSETVDGLAQVLDRTKADAEDQKLLDGWRSLGRTLRDLGLRGRGYDLGLYGEACDRTAAVSAYREACRKGNLDAVIRLRKMVEGLDAVK